MVFVSFRMFVMVFVLLHICLCILIVSVVCVLIRNLSLPLLPHQRIPQIIMLILSVLDFMYFPLMFLRRKVILLVCFIVCGCLSKAQSPILGLLVLFLMLLRILILSLMENEDRVLIEYLYCDILKRLSDLRIHLPESFESQYNSLRAVEQWLFQFKNQFDTFLVSPF